MGLPGLPGQKGEVGEQGTSGTPVGSVLMHCDFLASVANMLSVDCDLSRTTLFIIRT
jgi:hypothetical protein